MIGVDEVGRGAWAGPLLVVAARAVTDLPDGLNDSKVLSKKRRESLRYDIEISCDIGEGWVASGEIDKLGLTASMRLAVKRALADINAINNEQIIIDGHINYCPSDYFNALAIIDADANYPIVSAASIYAKVIRDEHMAKLSKELPNYGFETHVGYGTAKHITALKKHGISPIHRQSYAPIKRMINGDQS